MAPRLGKSRAQCFPTPTTFTDSLRFRKQLPTLITRNPKEESPWKSPKTAKSTDSFRGAGILVGALKKKRAEMPANRRHLAGVPNNLEPASSSGVKASKSFRRV